VCDPAQAISRGDAAIAFYIFVVPQGDLNVALLAMEPIEYKSPCLEGWIAKNKLNANMRA